MTIFYKDKNYRDQYERARFNGATREEARSQAELMTLAIYGTMAIVALALLIFFLIAVYIIIIFINSPGIGFVELLKSYVGLETGRVASWILSSVVSLIILAALYFRFKAKHKILGPAIYAGLCAIVSLSLLNLEDGFGRNIGLRFLIDYAPQETIAKAMSRISSGRQAKDIEENQNLPVSPVSLEIDAAKKEVDVSIVNEDVSVGREAVGVVELDSAEQNLVVNPGVSAVGDGKDVSNDKSPSFDCGSTKYESEKIVCSNYELATLDNIIAEKYRALRALSENDPSLKSSQIAWIKSVRLCENSECIMSLYKNRLSDLDAYQVNK